MIRNWIGFYTLSSREIMRFFSVWRQTIIPGIITTLLYIFVFGVALENRISEINGVQEIDTNTKNDQLYTYKGYIDPVDFTEKRQKLSKWLVFVIFDLF